LSLSKRREAGQPLWPIYVRIFRRFVVLWLCGIFVQQVRYHVELPGFFTRPELYSNTLQAIAVGYLVTALALLHLPIIAQIALFFVLLFGYWALLTFMPFPPYPAGHFEQTANLALYVDNCLFGDYRRDHAFTWGLTSIGFAASVLMGAMAGHIFRRPWSPNKKMLWLVSLGAISAWAGWEWSFWMPLNRHLWTSSMILWAGGWAFLSVALFYWVVDVAKIRWWTFPFIVLGLNALVAYVLDAVVDKLSPFAARLVLGLRIDSPGGGIINLLDAFFEVGFVWLIVWLLYRNRISLRA
jgi:predicted acyltransferase